MKSTRRLRIGLLAAAALALAPALTSADLAAGAAVWAYTLLRPSFIGSGLLDRAILDTGLFGIEALKPQALFGFLTTPAFRQRAAELRGYDVAETGKVRHVN